MKRTFIDRIWMAGSTSLAVLLLAACSTLAEMNVVRVETGAVQTAAIQAPVPAGEGGMSLQLEFIGGRLNVAPGADGSLVSGEATFNAADIKPVVEMNGRSVTIRQGEERFEGFPVFEDDVVNTWDVYLADVPMDLSIQAGAYDGVLELGGLSLKSLTIAEGGSDFSGSFSEPNRTEMSTFTFSTGGSAMVWKGLANANFSQMDFDAGPGDYTLSFDGTLQRDANVSIESGAGTVNIIVPKDTRAALTFDGGMTSINNEGWVQDENLYTLSGGNGHALNITIEMGLGTLNLIAE